MKVNRITIVALGATAVAATSGALAYAAVGGPVDGAGAVHSCYANKTGALRAVSPTTACASSETALSWNQTGPTGPAGPVGPGVSVGAEAAGSHCALGGVRLAGAGVGFVCNGATGAKGDPGAAGVDGVNGIDGKNGAPGPAGPVGPQGPAGPQGPKGAPGAVGPAGAIGPAGPDGSGPGYQLYDHASIHDLPVSAIGAEQYASMVHLDLPDGSYQVLATYDVANTYSPILGNDERRVSCKLAQGSGPGGAAPWADVITSYIAGHSHTERWTQAIQVTNQAATPVSLGCDAGSGTVGDVQIRNVRMIATRITSDIEQ
jgi:hypothetical protein